MTIQMFSQTASGSGGGQLQCQNLEVGVSTRQGCQLPNLQSMAGTSVCLSKGTSVLGLFHIVPCFCSGQESGPWVICAWYPKAGPLALVAQEFQEATLGDP